ncbi:MAG: VWA domain-containing protein [Campylobacterota bacterium]|nr:VWA domain-containing protein [Campylobacterota bacterium]
MKKLLLGSMLVLAALFTGLSAEDNPRAVIIFDASGSMWGQINGVTKIEIAKDALKNVVKEWNPNVELGLTVYGHRSKGDCDDIETVIPVGKIDKDRVISTVMDIKPKGKTPISRSLRKVAEEIKYTEEKATIILISDGKETCDPDPCGTAKGLEKQGIDFVVHVIGFNVDKKTDKQLECIASATGGEYFSAKNAAALNDAMKVIAKKVEVVEPKPEPKPVVKKPKNNLEVTASEKEDGKWIKAYHRIYKVEDGTAEESQAASFSSNKKDAGKGQLPVGKYLIKSEYNKFKKETPFELKSGEVTKIHVVMGQTGQVEISASEKEDGKWIKAYHRIYKVEDGTAEESQAASFSSNKKDAGKGQLPVGKYLIKSEYNKFKKETPFELKSGEVTKIHVTFGQFFIEAECSDMGANVSYEIYASNGRLVYEKQTKCSNALKVTLDDGDYIVESKINSTIKETKFSVGANHPNKITIDLQNLNHEEEIKADSAEPASTLESTPAPMQDEQKSEKITIGDKQIEIKGISQKDAEKIKELGAMLGVLGGMMQGGNEAANKEKKAEQDAKNAEADKEFEEMSKDLDMYTK